MRRVEHWLDQLGHRLLERRSWNLGLAGAGLLALLASWLFYPVGDDVHVFGLDPMGPCAFQEENGLPCASCGMTRAWVWAARGHLGVALRYNVAGTLLYLGLIASGVVGAVRLAAGRPDLARWRFPWVIGAGVAWLALYVGTWGLRVLGHYPLQGP